MIPIIILIILTVFCIYLALQNAMLRFKKGYYEQTIMNNKEKFSPARFEKIMQVRDKNLLEFMREIITFKE